MLITLRPSLQSCWCSVSFPPSHFFETKPESLKARIEILVTEGKDKFSDLVAVLCISRNDIEMVQALEGLGLTE